MTNKIATIFAMLATAVKTFFVKLAVGIKQFFFRKQPDQATTAPATDATNNNLDNDDSYVEYNAKIGELNDVMVNLGLHQRISATQKYMYEMGRRDGALGVALKNLAEIARATAQEMFRHIYVILQGSLAALEAEKKTRHKIMEYDDLCHQRDQAYHDYVQYQYRFFPRTYSWFLFGFYLFIGLALILADMPLALKLIQDGFNIAGGGTDSQSIPHLFIGNFWEIVALNWETFTTAMGISLCTVYIKIFYDEFIGTPYANKTMTFRRFTQENNLNNSEQETEAMQQDIKKEYGYKRAWKTGLAFFTVAAIVVLALFRLQTAYQSGNFELSFASGAAFVIITVLFPIIGGICLSHALTNFQNMVRLQRARRKCAQSRKEYLSAMEAYTLVQKKYEDLWATSERLCEEDRMVEEYQDYLKAFYIRGFSTGGMQPEKYIKGEDFYSKVMEWRNMAISRKINHHISGINTDINKLN
jgi:hypothetical protein